MVALYFVYYDVGRVRQTLRVTPDGRQNRELVELVD
jgi:hypothetical protein